MKTILIAEDNPSSRELLREILTAEGYRVLEAADGEQAIAQLRASRPDLAVLDVQMPKVDGIKVVRAVREDPKLADLLVLAFTAFAMHGDRERILAAGFDGYLTKPLDVRALSSEIAAVLAGRMKREIS